MIMQHFHNHLLRVLSGGHGFVGKATINLGVFHNTPFLKPGTDVFFNTMLHINT